MNCEHVHKVLDAYLDGELDEATNAQLAQHLDACPALREPGGRTQGPAHRHPAVAAPCGARVAAALDPARAGERRPRVRREAAAQPCAWWQAGGLAGMAAALAFVLGLWIAAPREVDLREQVIARHVASLAKPGAWWRSLRWTAMW